MFSEREEDEPVGIPRTCLAHGVVEELQYEEQPEQQAVHDGRGRRVRLRQQPPASKQPDICENINVGSVHS